MIAEDRQRIAQHLVLVGIFVDDHWDEIKVLLPNSLRHELGGEIGKIRLLRALLWRHGSEEGE